MLRSVKTFLLLFILLFIAFAEQDFSIDHVKYINNKFSKGSFPLLTKGKTASLLVNENDFSGVLKVVKHLQADIKNITNSEPNLSFNKVENAETVVVI